MAASRTTAPMKEREVLQEERVREAIARAAGQQVTGPFPPVDPAALAAKLDIPRRYSGKIRATLLGSTECEELERFQSQCQAELREAAKQQKRAVLRRSVSQAELLRSQLESWRRSQELLASRKSLSPSLNFNFVILDTPGLILPSQDLDLFQVSPAPWNNVARVKATWTSPYPDNGSDTLSYVFAWRNPADHDAVINIGSYLMLNGFCDAEAGPGWTHSDLQVSTRLNIFEWWNNPATQPPGQSAQFNFSLPSLNAEGGKDTGVGEYLTLPINGSYDVEYRHFTVPAKEVAVFTVSLNLWHSVRGDGYIEVDFASGGFEVMCPALLIGILN
jgi:hypothetical protein